MISTYKFFRNKYPKDDIKSTWFLKPMSDWAGNVQVQSYGLDRNQWLAHAHISLVESKIAVTEK